MIESAHLSANQNGPLITIIIPTFNRPQYIAEAVTSALNQNYNSYEVLVIDDGSNDNTEEIISKIDDERLTYIKKNHSGAPDTRNRGIREAKGDYILWLDSDDILLPNILNRYIDVLSMYPDVDVLYGDLEVFTEDGQLQILKYVDYYSEKNLVSRLIFHNIFPNPGSLVRKETYIKYGIYNPNFTRAHDYEFWCRIAVAAKFKHIGQLCCRWRWHEGNMSSGTVKYDTSYEAKIVKALVNKHPLEKLFPGFDWREPKRAESLSFHKIGEILDAYKDHDSANEFYHKAAYYHVGCFNADQPSITGKGSGIQCDSCCKVLGKSRDDRRVSERNFRGLYQRPVVSVIVPTYNRPEKLVNTLKSILNQTYPHFEIIVVNDAGENVEDIVTQVDHSHKITYVRHSKNKGLSYARNTAIRLATGKYIAYLDDDDLYNPDHLESLVEFLEDSDFKVAYTDAYRVHYKKNGQEYYEFLRDIPYSSGFNHEKMLVRNFIPVLCVMHEKSCIDDVGFFDKNLKRLEDWDLWIRLSQKYRFAHIEKTTCSFSWFNDGTTMSSGDQGEFIQAFEYIYSKHQSLSDNRPLVKAAQEHILASHRVQRIIEQSNGDAAHIIRQLENILEIEPNLLEAHQILSTLYEKRNNPQMARFHINKSNEIIQHIIPTEPYLSLCYSTTAASENDQPRPKASSKIRSDGVKQKLKTGEKRVQEGHIEDAEVIFSDILASEPDHVEARNNLAYIHWKIGNKSEALQELLKAMKIAPDNRDVIWNCGQFMIELGFAEDALEIYRNYLSNHPDDDDVRAAVLTLEESTDNSEHAYPNMDPNGLISQGERLYQDGKFDEALLAFEKAVAMGGESALVHNNLAAVHQARGDLDKAAEHMRKALKLEPEDRDAIWNCGQIFIQSGFSEDALALYEDFLSKHPDDLEVREAMAAL